MNWYERLKRLYSQGKIDEVGLANAVKRGWITQEEMDSILRGDA